MHVLKLCRLIVGISHPGQQHVEGRFRAELHSRTFRTDLAAYHTLSSLHNSITLRSPSLSILRGLWRTFVSQDTMPIDTTKVELEPCGIFPEPAAPQEREDVP